MIWTLEMLHSVERLGMSMELDIATLYGYPEAKERTKHEMSQRMVRFAHPLGVEIHPEDIAFREEEQAFSLKLYARWRPTTTLVEFRGGYVDGQRMTAAPDLIGQPIRVPAREPVTFALTKEEMVPRPSDPLQYDLAGWHEQERHWIYDATPPRHRPTHP
jgi:hypothetical protein